MAKESARTSSFAGDGIFEMATGDREGRRSCRSKGGEGSLRSLSAMGGVSTADDRGFSSGGNKGANNGAKSTPVTGEGWLGSVADGIDFETITALVLDRRLEPVGTGDACMCRSLLSAGGTKTWGDLESSRELFLGVP